MDRNEAFARWAAVELLGRVGETYEDVVNRISAEGISKRRSTPGWSFIPLDWDGLLDPPEPLPSAPRYVWKDPTVKNTIRKPRKARSNVSRETLSSVSKVKRIIKRIPGEWTWNDGTPIVVNREEIALMTKRQEELAMRILLGKEYDGKD